MTFLIGLDDEAEDKISGFRGTVTGRAEYSTGCRQYLCQPRSTDPATYPAPQWFDEDRLMVMEAAGGRKPTTTDTVGGPAIHAAPRR